MQRQDDHRTSAPISVWHLIGLVLSPHLPTNYRLNLGMVGESELATSSRSLYRWNRRSSGSYPSGIWPLASWVTPSGCLKAKPPFLAMQNGNNVVHITELFRGLSKVKGSFVDSSVLSRSGCLSTAAAPPWTTSAFSVVLSTVDTVTFLAVLLWAGWLNKVSQIKAPSVEPTTV